MKTKTTIQRSTNQQILRLVQYMKENPDFSHDILLKPVDLDKHWNALTEILNELGPDRSVQQWKNTWRDLKISACAEASLEKSDVDGIIQHIIAKKRTGLIKPDIKPRLEPKKSDTTKTVTQNVFEEFAALPCLTVNGVLSPVVITSGPTRLSQSYDINQKATEKQIEKLAECMFRNKDFANGFLGPPRTETKWLEVGQTLKEFGPDLTIEQWKKLWEDLKTRARTSTAHPASETHVLTLVKEVLAAGNPATEEPQEYFNIEYVSEEDYQSGPTVVVNSGRKFTRCTNKQIEKMVEFMHERPDFATDTRYRGPSVHSLRDSQWQLMKETLKKYGPDKSVIQWKQTWRDFKYRFRGTELPTPGTVKYRVLSMLRDIQSHESAQNVDDSHYSADEENVLDPEHQEQSQITDNSNTMYEYLYDDENMEEAPADSQSKRKFTRCTLNQTLKMVKYMRDNREFALLQPPYDAAGEKQWVQLRNYLNEFGPDKTVKQWKKTWKDIKRRRRFGTKDDEISKIVNEIICNQNTTDEEDAFENSANEEDVFSDFEEPTASEEKTIPQSKKEKCMSVRCTSAQLRELVQYMSSNREFANNTFTGAIGHGIVDAQWIKLKDILNKLGPEMSIEQWKQTWESLKRKVKDNLSDSSPITKMVREIMCWGEHEVVVVKCEMSSNFDDSVAEENAAGDDAMEECGTVFVNNAKPSFETRSRSRSPYLVFEVNNIEDPLDGPTAGSQDNTASAQKRLRLDDVSSQLLRMQQGQTELLKNICELLKENNELQRRQLRMRSTSSNTRRGYRHS